MVSNQNETLKVHSHDFKGKETLKVSEKADVSNLDARKRQFESLSGGEWRHSCLKSAWGQIKLSNLMSFFKYKFGWLK